jgi:hypothetical protein
MSIFGKRFSARGVTMMLVIQTIFALIIQVLFEHQMHQAVGSFRDHGMGLYELQLNALQLRRYEKDYFLAANDPVERPRYLQLWRDYQRLLQGNLDQVRTAQDFSADERAKLSEWIKMLRLYSKDFEASVASVEAHILKFGKIDDVVVAYSQMGEARRAIRVVLGQAQEITDMEYAQLERRVWGTTILTRLCFLSLVCIGLALIFSMRTKAVKGVLATDQDFLHPSFKG